MLVEDLLFNRRFSLRGLLGERRGVLVFLTGKQRDLIASSSGATAPGAVSASSARRATSPGSAASPCRATVAGRRSRGSTRRTSDADIWLYDVVRGTETRLARPGSDDCDPIFSRDGGDPLLRLGSADEDSVVLRRDLASGVETSSSRTEDRYAPALVDLQRRGSLVFDLRGRDRLGSTT